MWPLRNFAPLDATSLFHCFILLTAHPVEACGEEDCAEVVGHVIHELGRQVRPHGVRARVVLAHHHRPPVTQHRHPPVSHCQWQEGVGPRVSGQ
jgi:hypothetical protein